MTELTPFSPGNRDKKASVRAAALSDQQWGVIDVVQLRACGVSQSAAGRWCQAARLFPMYPGVYAFGRKTVPIEGRLVAALLHAGPGAVLSHTTAAWWWGLTTDEPVRIEVSATNRTRSQPDLLVHHPRVIDATRHRRFPITTVAQSVLDFAATAPLDRVRYALAEADYRDLLDLQAVEEVLGRGRPGSRLLRKALRRHQPAYARTRSELENAFLRLCERHRIPIPAVNVMVEGWLVDAVWVDRRVVVELDGNRGHRTPAQLERDHSRDLQLRAAGFTVVRYTWAQVTEQTRVVAADLRRLLGFA